MSDWPDCTGDFLAKIDRLTRERDEADARLVETQNMLANYIKRLHAAEHERDEWKATAERAIIRYGEEEHATAKALCERDKMAQTRDLFKRLGIAAGAEAQALHNALMGAGLRPELIEAIRAEGRRVANAAKEDE